MMLLQLASGPYIAAGKKGGGGGWWGGGGGEVNPQRKQEKGFSVEVKTKRPTRNPVCIREKVRSCTYSPTQYEEVRYTALQ